MHPKCVQRYCELANLNVEQLYKVFTPCIDDQFTFIWRASTDLIFCGLWTNWHERSRSWRELVTDAWPVRFVTFIARVGTGSIVMWETTQNSADCDSCRTQILPQTSKTLRRHQEVFCACSEVQPLFQSVGCARSRRQSSSQFHRVWGNILGCWFTHGRHLRSGPIGFGYWCFALITVTHRHGERRCNAFTVWEASPNPNEVETSHVGRRVFERDWLRWSEREIFSLHYSVTHFWRQWSNDKDYHQRQKSNDETRFSTELTLIPNIQVKYVNTRSQFANILT